MRKGKDDVLAYFFRNRAGLRLPIIKRRVKKDRKLRSRRLKIKRMKDMLETGQLEKPGNVGLFDNPAVRNLVLKEYRSGKSIKEIVNEAGKLGFPIKETQVRNFLDGRMKVLSNVEIHQLKNSIFGDTEKLYESINGTIATLTDKIEQWKTEGMDKELLMGISQLREYQLMAMKRLGEIKDAVTKVEKQFNQTNIIVAKHQTDYLKDLAGEGKIRIIDPMLIDIVYGKPIQQVVSDDKNKPEEAESRPDN